MNQHMSRHLLTIVRHGTAPSAAGHFPDFNRHLDDQGISESLATGSWLSGCGVRLPDIVFCSAASRTRETLDRLQSTWEGLGRVRTEYSELLYGATSQVAMEYLILHSERHQHILLVGHNPTVSELATGLGNEYVRLSPGNAVVCKYNGSEKAMANSLCFIEDWSLVHQHLN